MRSRFRFSLGLAIGLCVGCGPPRVVETALHGDLAELKGEITRSQTALDDDDVVALARAVARREVHASTGARAVSQIRRARGCLSPVIEEIRGRADHFDDAGAEAALILLDVGLVDESRVAERFGRASSAPWRAVGARAATRPADGPLRRKLIADPDERVRRAAIAASYELADPADLDALSEAARLDPDPLSRSQAIRAIGKIGGERASVLLRDLWAGADEQDRLAIVEAWATSPTFDEGGAEQLRRVAENASSLVGVAAAAELQRRGEEGADTGRAVLVRAVRDGTSEQRRLAIRRVPLDAKGALDALRRAADSDDRPVRVMALARLLETDRARPQAVDALREMARGKGNPAFEARVALAVARDTAVIAGLKRDLAARWAYRREGGALALVRLGRLTDAAPALADDDPAVRMGVACGILASRAVR